MFVMLVISGADLLSLHFSVCVCGFGFRLTAGGWMIVSLFFHNTEFIHFAGIPPMLS